MAKAPTTKTVITKITYPKKRKKAKRKAGPANSASSKKVETLLIENFVSLQKAITSMTVHFSSLSKRIENLLGLFEISAKAIAQKDFNQEDREQSQRDLLIKIDTMVEQNKVIARGLTLLHNTPIEKEVSWESQERTFKRPVTTGYNVSQNPPARQVIQQKKPTNNPSQNTTRMQGFKPS